VKLTGLGRRSRESWTELFGCRRSRKSWKERFVCREKRRSSRSSGKRWRSRRICRCSGSSSFGMGGSYPSLLDSSRFESLILSHHSRFTCECNNKEDINDDDDDDAAASHLALRLTLLPLPSAFWCYNEVLMSSKDLCVARSHSVRVLRFEPSLDASSLWSDVISSIQIPSLHLVNTSLPPSGQPSYRGTSLIRNSAPLGPYSRTMPRILWWS